VRLSLNKTQHTLCLQNVSIGNTETDVLIENININIESPCLIGLIGNNGCGKTTLLKTMSGLQKKISGIISYNEKEITSFTNKELSKIITFGFAFAGATFPMGVYELVAMGRYPYLNNMASLNEADNAIVLEAINTTGIFHLKDKLITAISDGERQKAYIAKALAQQTPVLLLDEPTAFLDYTSKKHFFKTVKENTVKRNTITIISSHDIDFLIRNTDYLWMIQGDKQALFDSTEQVVQSDYFKANFNY
jgi:iron complex transport system ATP-binding protein